MADNRTKKNDGWSKGHPTESGWYLRQYSEVFESRDYFDAERKLWRYSETGGSCTLQSRNWRRIKEPVE